MADVKGGYMIFLHHIHLKLGIYPHVTQVELTKHIRSVSS